MRIYPSMKSKTSHGNHLRASLRCKQILAPVAINEQPCCHEHPSARLLSRHLYLPTFNKRQSNWHIKPPIEKSPRNRCNPNACQPQLFNSQPCMRYYNIEIELDYSNRIPKVWKKLDNYRFMTISCKCTITEDRGGKTNSQSLLR